MEEISNLPILSAQELRVLGSLLEKSKTTPEYYPLTLNALMTACNQKTSRKPVVSYDENIILDALDKLRKRGLTSTAIGGGSRVTKYKHNLAIQYPLIPQDLAVLCLLILRGPLTPGEINNNAGRLFDFESIEEVQQVINRLMESTPPFVKQLSKKPGQKEVRFIHLLGDINEDDYETLPYASTNKDDYIETLEARVEVLEIELNKLREEFNNLMEQLR
ncbi:YceH family protein [Sphingobacterium sp. UT-1RO-CII-1]|uniref:YceH family protein n=1 Tax=Sphingobacterium sp. UT-1RO-CII-1 TaxID=2995225 RepID=UPI00227D1516|nr:YceH family protein [Sphingobacterium sp. UT-1RO-CII-1]MCY4781358.1 YceH family protein [Sphingobacterium sp. UT-1RO-CII-1]